MTPALDVARRLEALGIVVRSTELAEEAKALQTFALRGGNRAMRRATAKRARRKR